MTSLKIELTIDELLLILKGELPARLSTEARLAIVNELSFPPICTKKHCECGE